MGMRRVGREFALQALYLTDLTGLSPEKALHGLMLDPNIDPQAKKFSKALVTGVFLHKDDLDAMIVKYTVNWEMKRMAALDRNILRLGSYELLYELETPASVIIDEAVEIAKTYSTEDSGRFVNGILDKIKLERKTIASKL